MLVMLSEHFVKELSGFVDAVERGPGAADDGSS
jgi:hypothetical protein